MAGLVAAVVLIGLISLLNLILTLAVIRRLREHTTRLGALSGGPPAVEVGQAIGEFTTETVSGQQVGRDLLAEEALVGFFTPHCEPCKERLPEFVASARSAPGGPERVLATVVGDGEAAAELVASLRPVARVVREAYGGPVSTAFQVRMFPTVLRVGPDAAGRIVVLDNNVPLGAGVVAAR